MVRSHEVIGTQLSVLRKLVTDSVYVTGTR